MAGSHGYKKILGPEDDRSLTRNVWVPESQYNEWKRIKDGKDGNYYMTSLFRSVVTLAQTPGGRKAVSQGGRYGDFDLSYKISSASRDIYLNLVALSNNTEFKGKQSPGLYRTVWRRDHTKGDWAVEEENYTSMDLTHCWGGARTQL